jgi:hypothetical protein
VTTQEGFPQILRQVCQERSWELVPSGVHLTMPGNRQQLVELEFFQFKDEDLVRFHTTIGDFEKLNLVQMKVALSINVNLAHGCLAVKDNQLVMTDTLMLKDANFGEIEASIAYLAETADYYEKTIFGTDQY